MPSDAAQLGFLANVQRILQEGRFTATYKFALLIALTDLAVERNERHGDEIAGLLLDIQATADRESATGVAKWAYHRAADSASLVWCRRGVTRPFPAGAPLPF